MSSNNKHNVGKKFLKKQLPTYIKLVSSLSFVVGAMGVALPGYAQVANASDEVEEVVVSGQRKSIESAQTIKRESEVVVDSVTAVDIGALPDRSVSEALQRIPGVQLQRTNENRDPARLAAEGGAVFVRGLSWVRTELNGRDIFSASSGRSLGFEDVSADLMSGVDVYKSPAADMIEGGIGGTVNLRTRLPFDASERVVAGSIDYNYAELYEKGFGSGSALYSDRWDTDIGEFGFLVSASLAEIGNRTDSVQTGRYEAYDINPSDTAVDNRYLPTGLGFRRIDWEQERNAFATAVQWAPNDDFTLTLQALRTEANPVDVERSVGMNTAFGNNISPGSGTFTYDSRGFVQSGSFSDATVALNTRYGKKETSTSDVSLGFEFTPDDHWVFSGDLQYVKSDADVMSMTAFTYLNHPDGDWQLDGDGKPIPGAVNPHSGVDVEFDLSGSKPYLSVGSPDRQVDPSQYFWGAAMDHIEDNDADALTGRLDAKYDFNNDGFIRSLAFGARATDRDTITRQSGWNWSIVSHQFWGGADSAYVSDVATDEAELYRFDNFYGGDIAVPAIGWMATEGVVSSSGNYNAAMKDTLAATIATLGWGWAPLKAPGAYDLNPQGDNVSAGINDQNERTNAGYVMVRFGDDSGEILGVPFDGNLGVRVVQTDTAARGRSGAGGVGSSCATSATAACVGATAFVTDFNNQFGDYKIYNNSYTNTLPSLNLRFEVADDVQLRFGASRAMVRPSFSQIRPYSNISFDFEGAEFDPDLNGLAGTATAGSPDLKPTVADQLDASAEWYFAESGSLTLSLFHKKLKDYITAATITEGYTYGGQRYEFEVTRQLNAADGTLKGFEVAYQQFFDMLPAPFDGFGVQSNFTYIDNEGGANTAINVFDSNQTTGSTNTSLPVEGMSKTSYNLALMYEKYDVSARLAYNWRERYLLTTSAANINRPVWFNDFGQLDASVFYTFNDKVKAGIQVTNLLAEETTLEVGDAVQTGDYSWTQGDRRIAFVVRAQF